ncbi:hypothetical protein VTO42DRAFT_2463 [Malbranchea cinnamomea]
MRALRALLTSALCLLLPSLVSGHSDTREPINYISLLEDPVIHTPSHRVHALSHFDVSFALHQKHQRIKLSLEPNHDILADDAQVAFLDKEGNVARTEPIHRHHHRVFKGKALVQLQDGSWERVGWARLTVKRDGAHPLFEGTFSVLGDHHHIMLRSKYMRTRHELDPTLAETTEECMVVFRDSDIGDPFSKRSLSSGHGCGVDELGYNTNPDHPIFNAPAAESEDMSLWGSVSLDTLFGLGITKRQSDTGGGRSGAVNLRSTIGSTAGCPKMRKVALLGVATDCAYTKQLGGRNETWQNVISVVNDASEVYERTFNITLGLRNLTVSDEDCPERAPASTPWNFGCVDNDPGLGGRLNLFSGWRAEAKDDNAFWMLMTGCATDSKVGVAWLGTLCINTVAAGVYDRNNASSTVTSGAGVVFRTRAEWQVFAHEAGHIFGAVHDCDEELCARSLDTSSQCCPYSRNTCDAGSRFLMNSASRDNMREFSPCTVGNICSSMARHSVITSCLSSNRGVTTITGSQCGNGVVEEGEECDCGGEQGCGDNQCCDPQTCRFRDGAQCDDANEECCTNCKFASSDTICRAAGDECDPAEYCTGNSSGCPKDEHAPDGQKCGRDGFTCASGQCTSRDEQCRLLMGAQLDGNDTYACDDVQCTLMCRSPSLPPRECHGMMQYFLDGTPCAGGGKCYNGNCEGASWGKEIKSWIDDHLPLVIGLSVGLGSLLLISILSCIFRRCRRRRHRKFMSVFPPGYAGPPPPPPPYPHSPGGYQWRGGQQPWQNVAMNDLPSRQPPRGPPYQASSPFRYA